MKHENINSLKLVSILNEQNGFGETVDYASIALSTYIL